MKSVNLSKYENSQYQPGNQILRVLWYCANAVFFNTKIPWPSELKQLLLKSFGATVGLRTVIKPCINIKYPWFLELGDNVWIGEGVWIDNLCSVKIGNHVCISQGVYMTTGNHDYTKETFDLIIKPVEVGDGVWIGAKAVVCPGTVLKSHSVVTAGSVISKSTESYQMYRGNPAEAVGKREIH